MIPRPPRRIRPSEAHHFTAWSLGQRTDCALCGTTGRTRQGRTTVTCGRCGGAGWHYEKEVTR